MEAEKQRNRDGRLKRKRRKGRKKHGIFHIKHSVL